MLGLVNRATLCCRAPLFVSVTSRPRESRRFCAPPLPRPGGVMRRTQSRPAGRCGWVIFLDARTGRVNRPSSMYLVSSHGVCAAVLPAESFRLTEDDRLVSPQPGSEWTRRTRPLGIGGPAAGDFSRASGAFQSWLGRLLRAVAHAEPGGPGPRGRLPRQPRSRARHQQPWMSAAAGRLSLRYVSDASPSTPGHRLISSPAGRQPPGVRTRWFSVAANCALPFPPDLATVN